MRKAVLLLALALSMICSMSYAYDLETLYQARYRNVEITMKDGTQVAGYVWDVVKIIEDESNKVKVVSYGVTSQDFGKIRVTGDELTSNTRTKYYLVLRKGVVEYQIDSDNIALLGIQKW